MMELTTALTYLFLSLLVYYLFTPYIGRLFKKYPPGPYHIPVLGNSYLLRKFCKKYNGLNGAIEQLSATYKSDVVGLTLGGSYTILLASEELILEALKRDEFQGRPDNFFIRLRSMGTRKGITMTDGDIWRIHRPFAFKTLKDLGFGRAEMNKLITEELHDFISDLRQGGLDTNLHIPLSRCVMNVLWAFTTGVRFSKGEPSLDYLLNVMRERSKLFDMAGGLLTQHPWLRFIAPNYTGYNLILELNTKMRRIILDAIEKHKQTYKENVTRDYIDAYLHQANEKSSYADYFSEEQLVMVCMDFFLAGSSTTSSSIQFVLLFLVSHPSIQKRAQEEIDKVLKGRLPEQKDSASMPFMNAILLETQRLRGIAPVIGPRRVLTNTQLGGYFIPKETTVLLNVSAMSIDPEKWDDVTSFNPSRFLDTDGNFIQTEKFYPFGMGKRRCPGEALAKSCMFVFVTGLLQKYTLTPSGSEPPSLDPIPGINISPRPFTLKLIPR